MGLWGRSRGSEGRPGNNLNPGMEPGGRGIVAPEEGRCRDPLMNREGKENDGFPHLWGNRSFLPGKCFSFLPQRARADRRALACVMRFGRWGRASCALGYAEHSGSAFELRRAVEQVGADFDPPPPLPTQHRVSSTPEATAPESPRVSLLVCCRELTGLNLA